MKVSDVMTCDVITVPRSASLKEAASVLVQHDISGVPVVDGGGKVVGVFSEQAMPAGTCSGTSLCAGSSGTDSAVSTVPVIVVPQTANDDEEGL
jgi:predicted transcriptional regulator